VLRPVRRDRRFGAKSDPIDADAAAGAVLSGKATAVPKAGDAGVEMVRALKIAKQTAIKARTQAVRLISRDVTVSRSSKFFANHRNRVNTR
jgi:transposase